MQNTHPGVPSDDGAPPAYAVVDIDGVLADVRHRLHHIHRRPKDWDAFFAAADADPPLTRGLELARELGASHDLVYLSGRPESCRTATEHWLATHEAPPGRLLLRRRGDRRPARITKIEILRTLAAERTVALLVDDDVAVCRAAETAGFRVLVADWATPDEPTLFDAQEGEGRS